MKRVLAVVSLVVAGTFAAGCSSGGAWTTPAASRAASKREVFGDIEQLQFAKQVQVVLPARLAVTDVSYGSDEDVRRRLAAMVEALSEDTSTWKDVGSLHVWEDEHAGRSSRFEFYRAAASRQQADLLLVAQRTETVRSEGNGLGLLKILILPIFFVPTERVTTQVHVHTAAVDVRNGLVYATTDHNRERESHAPWAFREDRHRDQADALYEESLPGLREQLARKLRVLEGTR